MGAADFWTKAKGRTAREAFADAAEEARYMHGHGGYTGTIAEKSRFKMVTVPAGADPETFAKEQAQDFEGHGFWNDKWGEAACVDLGNGEYVFFGSARC